MPEAAAAGAGTEHQGIDRGGLNVRVEPFGGDSHEWDAFVRSAPGWTHFHLSGWKRVIERVFDHECLYTVARDEDGRPAGVLPLVRVKSLVFGHYLVSLPFVNYGGPLGSPDAVRALGAQAAERAAVEGVRLLELRSRRELPLPYPVSHRKITVLLDLPRSADALWSSLDPKVRSQIRRPRKDGVTVRFGADEVAPFFEVFSRHMRDLGTPTQSRRLFEAIAETFGGDAWFACAYLGGRPIAAGCALRWDGELEMTWASSLVEFKRCAPNMLLYWSVMERAIDEGVTTFNFGRCTPDSGTHRFKRQWGSRDEALWWYDIASRRDATTPSPKDAGYAWGPRIWRRLPTPVATALGPRIVRYIP